MKRVQLILEEWQHEWLAEESRKTGQTISLLARQFITAGIERKQAKTWQDDPIWGIVGLAEGPDDGVTSDDLDTYIYPPQSRQPVLKIAERSDNDTDDNC